MASDSASDDFDYNLPNFIPSAYLKLDISAIGNDFA